MKSLRVTRPLRQMPRCALMSASGVLRNSWNNVDAVMRAMQVFTALLRRPERVADSYRRALVSVTLANSRLTASASVQPF